MTHVHYKFSSKLSYDTVVFDGPHITLRDLKRQIMGREKLRAGDCDLQITNAQSKEEYTDDEGLISKGSSVIVRRIPVIGARPSSGSKIRKVERSDVQLSHSFGAFKAMDDQNSSKAAPLFSKMANLAEANVSEEDKLNAVLQQSSYDSMNYSKKFAAVLPSNYTCYRCGNTGHHIRNCPNSGPDKNAEAPVRMKKSTGIPRSFMVEVDDPNMKGAMLTNCGRYAIPAIDAEAYAIGKKERPPFASQEQPKSEDEEDPVPDELLCLICHDLLSDAVVIPCCGNSYCDDCIRTTLLDSEEHVCPTCSQSDVSPDTLIANKFLRQAIDNFKRERGHTKSLKRGCGSSQSQNPTPTPSPVPTPPPLTLQSQNQRHHLSTSSQQDPLLYLSQAADTPPLSQVCGALLTVTGPTSTENTLSTSLQLEIPDKEAEEKTHEDSATATTPSGPVSPKDPTDAPSQLIPLGTLTPEGEEPQTVSVNLQQPSSDPTQRPSGPPACWESSSSSSGCPPGGWNESNTQQHPPSSSSSSYQATPPPLFPSPHFHAFLSTQQPLGSYPPGYPPTTPVWALPNLQGAPIPSLCPSASIPALIPKEWYRYQRKAERSPHRGSSHRRSSSRSYSKSSKSKSSRSYSRSSSRSRSRSRSQSRSRPHSPYSRHRHLHTRSHSSRSYSYGYRRSPSPSSSSSPRVGNHSRSKSPSDHRKSSHHSRHHSRKSTSSSCTSRRRGEHSEREAGGSGGSFAPYPYAQHPDQTSSLEPDRERYLQWKREYKEWFDKYFSSYVGHFHQLPLPLLSLPPPPEWGEREGSRNHSDANSDSRHQSRRSSRRMDGRSPPSQSSSDSRSPPSQSSRDSRSTPSQSSSDSRSSPSHSSNDSRSPPSQSSSDGRSTPSEDGAQRRCSRLPATPAKNRKKEDLKEGSKDGQQLIAKNLANLSVLKHEQNSTKKHEEARREASSSTDAADSTDDCRKDKRKNKTESKDGSPAQDKAAASNAVESVQPLVKPDKHLDKEHERKSREQRNLEEEKGWRRGKYSDSRRDSERKHREKSRTESCRVDTDRYLGGSRASDSRSERSRKRKGEDTEQSSVTAQSYKTKTAEDPETQRSESPNSFDRKKPKMETKKERKTWPLTEEDIWEGGIKVKPPKKISININLDGKRKEEKTEKQDLSYLESIRVKAKEGNREDEKLNRGETKIEANEKEDSSRDMEDVSEGKIETDEREAGQKWEKATFRDDEGEPLEKKQDGENMEFDFWHSVLTGMEDEKMESKTQWEEGEGIEVIDDEKRSMRGGKEEQVMEDFVSLKDGAEGENTENSPVRSRNKSHCDGPNTTVDDGSHEDREERKRVVKTLEEYAQDRAADREDELVLIQVPRSKWEKEESEEEERDQGGITAQTDALATFLHSPSVSVTAEPPANMETETEEKRERSVELQRGRDREGQKHHILVSSHRNVAPSSGRHRTDLSSERDGGKRMEGERWRNRERERGRERSRDRQKESKRSKDRIREEEKGRDRRKERASPRRNALPSSHSYSYSTSHDTERRDRQQGGDLGGNKSSSSPGGKLSGDSSRATELPKQNTHKSYSATVMDFKLKDKDRDYHNHQDQSGNYRSTGNHHPQKRDPLPSGSELSKPRISSPEWEIMQNTSRNESKVEKGEWKLQQIIRESRGERDKQEMKKAMVAEGEGGCRREDEADELGRRRELEEVERPSSRSDSVSSSASQENGRDDGRKEKKKKHKKEKRQNTPELLDDEELKKRKKTSKKSRDGREEESSGRMDDRWKEEDDHTQLCSLMLS
ncbi:E3 ubiquitin-protein ligase RBBP6-like isoform X2 [Plectropomus leopardus]|uniref:E3 ubiquitin-protein ligase RBBP6-like isoform X2 n=1 Tax=Plectropomus leopardus TaxID=160734 RepID=UPI001C4B1838|nr:E3 ubiquitin-protein ligase RBBP6-like isoform X2 [Plectropomus leopardus]